MLTLAVDTSSAVGSVALVRDGNVLAETTRVSASVSPRTRTVTHSTNLVPTIEQLLSTLNPQPSALNLLAVGLGPGSFTGVRVAIATMKGYALALKKPVVGVSSMDALALAHKDRLPTGCTTLAAIVDAGRGETYCSTYSVLEGQFFKVTETTIVTIEQLRARILTPTFFIGPQLGEQRAALEKHLGSRAIVDGNPVHPSAAVVGLLAEEKFAEQRIGDGDIEPIYLRLPAEKR
jgi:tRNA threonylcarbamoyladenosine biosynthesis protein TsaB